MEAGFQKPFLGAAPHPVARKIGAFSGICFNKSLLPLSTNICFLIFLVTIGKKVYLVILLTERGNSSIFEFWPEETKKFKGAKYVVSEATIPTKNARYLSRFHSRNFANYNK